MRINTGTFNVAALQQTQRAANLFSNPTSAAAKSTARYDVSALRGKSKMSEALKALTEQRQSIIDKRGELVSSTLENGGTLESISQQLESYEKQLKGLDEQIAKSLLDELGKSDTDDGEKKKDTALPSYNLNTYSPQSLFNTQQSGGGIFGSIGSLIAMTGNANLLRVATSGMNRAAGEARVLRSEIKMDGGGSESKMKRLEKLSSHVQSVSDSIGANIGSITDGLGDLIKPTDKTDGDKNTTDTTGKTPEKTESSARKVSYYQYDFERTGNAASSEEKKELNATA